MTPIVATFTDVTYMFHGAMTVFHRKLDYEKYHEKLTSHGRILASYAYGSETENFKSEPFKALLRHKGFECRWQRKHYNWNVGISMDVVRLIDRVDLVILGSGDQFLAPCADWVRNQGIKCYAYGFQISPDMRKSVDQWFEIPETLLIGNQDDTSEVPE